MSYGVFSGQRDKVLTVNELQPDINGNIALEATDVNALPTSGGTMTGNIAMGNKKITGLPTPTANDEAAPKSYVDRAQDYVVAEGISGAWQYRKWNSGLAECWSRATADFVLNQPFGSLFISNRIERRVYPFSFIATPKEIAIIRADEAGSGRTLFTLCDAGPLKSSTGMYTPARPVANNSPFRASIDYFVVGQWR